MNPFARKVVLVLVCGLFAGLPPVSLQGTLASSRSLDRARVGRAIMLSRWGENALHKGKEELARRRFSEAVRLVENLPSAHLGLGHLAMNEGRYEDALVEYTSARDGWRSMALRMLRAESWVAIENHAAMTVEATLLQDSIDLLDQMSQSNLLEVLALDKSKLQNALTRVQGTTQPVMVLAEALVPGEAYFYIGNAHYKLGRIADAVGAWEACVERSPEFPLVYMNLALGYRAQGRSLRAHRSLRRLAELSDDLQPAYREAFWKRVR